MSKKGKVRKTHKRSAEKKKERRLAAKQRLRERKQREILEKKEMEINNKARLRELESTNAIMSREIKKIRRSTQPPRLTYSLPKSVIDATHSKVVSINQSFQAKVTEFSKNDLVLSSSKLGQDVFGAVRMGKLKSFQQQVSVKEIVYKHSSAKLHTYVEAKFMVLLNGHKSFPLFFGWIKPNMLIMEFIGSGLIQSPTLKVMLEEEDRFPIDKKSWPLLLVDICDAVKYMHDKGVLHNDLHARNILVRNLQIKINTNQQH